MHQASRRIVFYSLVALFVIAGSYAVLTALGFTLDPEEGVVRTGSLFIAGTPRDAELSINGKLAEERRGIISGGTLIRNLAPGDYMVEFAREGRVRWRAMLPIVSGLVTRATDIFLWPLAPGTTTVVAAGVDAFVISGGLPVIQRGEVLFRTNRAIPGTEFEYAAPETALLLTRTDNTIYLAEGGTSGTFTNLTALFQSLKERELGLPGAVPILKIRPHPFSQGKFVVVSKTSLYVLDIRRIAVERIATVDEITAVAFGDDEVLLAGADGFLTVVDLVFKTVETAPFASSTAAALALGAGGDAIIWHATDKTLTLFDRTRGEAFAVLPNVSSFALDPRGSRLAAALPESVEMVFLAPYVGDALLPRGSRFTVWEGFSARALAWNPALPRYLSFLADNHLLAAEVGLHGERSVHVIAPNVREFTLSGYTAYLLTEDGALSMLSFE